MSRQLPDFIEIKAEYAKVSDDFHLLMNSLDARTFQMKSLNPGWTNGEIVAHMTFGFLILNALLPMARFYGRLPREFSKPLAVVLNFFTRPFNWINMLGARGQGKVFTYKRVDKIYDRVNSQITHQINTIKEDEWNHGMYYPNKWDSNFDEFMTIRKLLLYPIVHYRFHLTQIAR